jgi:hypothetical protein
VINTITGLAGFKVGRMILFALLLLAVLDSVSYANIKAKSGSPLSIEAPSSWPDTCAHLKEWVGESPNDEATYKLQYDTLKQYQPDITQFEIETTALLSGTYLCRLVSRDGIMEAAKFIVQH